MGLQSVTCFDGPIGQGLRMEYYDGKAGIGWRAGALLLDSNVLFAAAKPFKWAGVHGDERSSTSRPANTPVTDSASAWKTSQRELRAAGRVVSVPAAVAAVAKKAARRGGAEPDAATMRRGGGQGAARAAQHRAARARAGGGAAGGTRCCGRGRRAVRARRRYLAAVAAGSCAGRGRRPRRRARGETPSRRSGDAAEATEVAHGRLVDK
jgi:hypothetical protein